MEYIRDHEAEKLLEKYSDMQGMIQNIKFQMRNVIDCNDVSDDDIAAMALKHSSVEDMVCYSPGIISDRTAKIATDCEIILTQENQESHTELRKLRKELLLLEVTINKIEVGLSTLSQMQRDILKARHCEKLVFAEIADKFLMSASAVKQKRIEAIERFSKISRITISEFEQVMRLFS